MPGYKILKPWWYWSNEPDNFFSAKELRILRRIHPTIKGIGGHTTRTYAGYEAEIKEPIFYFTFLRDPIARYLSHLNHQVNKMDVAWSVGDFLKETRFNNLMTIRVAGCEDLELAKRRLRDDFGMVGLFESYDESLVILSRMIFGAPNKLQYEHMNDSINEVKLRFDDLSPEFKERVIANNSLDIDLYDWVKKEIFPAYLNNYPGDFEEELRHFREGNSRFRYNRVKWYLLRFLKVYSYKLPQAAAHFLGKRLN